MASGGSFPPARFHDWLLCFKIYLAIPKSTFALVASSMYAIFWDFCFSLIWLCYNGFSFANRHKSSMKETTLTFSFLQLDNSFLSCHQIIYLWICLGSLTEKIILSSSVCFYLQFTNRGQLYNFSKETQAQKGSSYNRLNILKCTA